MRLTDAHEVEKSVVAHSRSAAVHQTQGLLLSGEQQAGESMSPCSGDRGAAVRPGAVWSFQYRFVRDDLVQRQVMPSVPRP